VLIGKGEQTEVTVSVRGGPVANSQPIHIHNGTCATLGSVRFPLTNLTSGRSVSTVNATLASLQTGAFAINAHKSAQEVSVCTSCGNIPGSGGAPTPTATAAPPAPTTPPASGQTIESAIQNFRLANLTVPVGATVRWTNRDSAPHTATTQGNPPARFNSGTLNQNQSFSFTFTRAGTYDIFCEFHPGMEATVTVGSTTSNTSASSLGYNYN